MSNCLAAAREALHRDITETLRLLRISREDEDEAAETANQERLDAMLDQLSTLGGDDD